MSMNVMQSSNKNENNNGALTICAWCGTPTTVIWVHGHGQCANCGTNIDECCRGEQCDNSLNESDSNRENGKDE